jgi:hypothetical protein
VNAETVNLIERPYLEIVDDLLTALVGGVVNEPLIFDVKSDLYPLLQPAKDVRGVTGTIDAEGRPEGIHHTFLKEVDFVFNQDKSAVMWQAKGQKPKDETTFYVDYFLTTSRSPLSDINVGSVSRTVGEAIGREIATVYQQINLAYLSGFIDTAKGKALDYVVSILGVTRKTKESAAGQATFFRDPAIEGNITIPQGTELTTEKGEVLFETIEPRTLQRGQARVDAPIRAGEKFKGEKGKVDAGKIVNPSQIIAGISRVTNFDPTTLAAEDESDEDLRLRAKAAIRGLGKATILALMKAVAETRATLKEISDSNTPGKKIPPGNVTVAVETEAGKFSSLEAALHETRAAGIHLTILARFVFVKLRIVVAITSGITADGKIKIANEIIAALQTYVEGLGSGKPAAGQELLKAITGVKDVQGVPAPRIVDVRTSRADVDGAKTNPLVEAIVAKLANVNPSDVDALRTAINDAVESEATRAPSLSRVPDRSLVRGVDARGTKTGSQATDGEIEAGKFLIAPPEGFSLILDNEPADIVFQEN